MNQRSLLKLIYFLPFLFSLVICSAFGAAASDHQPSAAKTIQVVMDKNYPPYAFLDSDGVLQGILADQWALWQKKTGIRVELKALDWKDALTGMQAGEFDVIDTIFMTEERYTWLDFSKPYARLEVSAFFNNEISGITDVKSLKDFIVAVKEGDAAVDFLQRHGLDKLVLYQSYEAIIQAAQAHKINVFVMDKPPALYLLHKYGMQNQYNVTQPFHSGAFHRAVSKGKNALLNQIETGFSRISPEELQQIETKWYGTPLAEFASVKFLLVGLGVTFLLIFVLVCWNRSLRTAVKKRTSELERSENELRKSETQYRELVENANSIILRWDREGRVTFFNEFAQRFFGYGAEEIFGKSVVGTILPETDQAGKNLQDLVRDIRLRPNHYAVNVNENMRRDGTRVWVYWTNKPLFDAAGDVSEILCVGNDITDQKRAEEKLQASNDLLSLFIKHSPIYAFVKEVNSTTSRVLHASDNYKDMVGIAGSAMVGKTMEDLFPAELAQKMTTDDWLVVSHGKILHLDENLNNRHYTSIKFPIRLGDKHLLAGYTIDITERKQMEEELRKRENQLQKILEILPVGLYFADKEGTLLHGNPMGVKIWGAEPKVPMSEYGIFKAWRLPSREPVEAEDWALVKTIRNGATVIDELLEIEAFDGKRKTILNYSAPVVNDQGEVDGAIAVMVDISDRIALEGQLRQAQKMESIGRLAGGVAHDFNNMLSVILGHSELALETLDPRQPLFGNLQNIRKAAQRSADLTQQLLAFARKQTVAPRVLDLNETVAGMLKMLQPLIGENIALAWLPEKEVGAVNMDPSQIDQILVNLCVNARDAIEGSGKVTIETGTAALDADFRARHADSGAGDYLFLTVKDTGCGMDQQTISHLFEPFFTTKTKDKGTGLGLATVYGIVKQNKGHIDVHSAPGQGTTFKIYLPRFAARTEQNVASDMQEKPTCGHETILLVEDEPLILEVARAMLYPLGYTVLSAATPGEAIRLAREHAGEIDLLMTDVVMPEMNGRDLARNLLSLYPDIKRLFMSGYTADVIAHHGVLDEGVYFIQKPFSMHDLAAKVREVLYNQH
ncbi:transporter substrate-binding domain-containing protein [Desulfopila sp. IMCC35006]|uniref:PAS domain S-box protein n=1 Tax=Desulfopila sp. IMCC35006 TaxID=2569542 RepID=UPI00142F1144|nr:transporter substrate-binding domain-containing protein [Desulfopila sp. IMCC35006]